MKSRLSEMASQQESMISDQTSRFETLNVKMIERIKDLESEIEELKGFVDQRERVIAENKEVLREMKAEIMDQRDFNISLTEEFKTAHNLFRTHILKQENHIAFLKAQFSELSHISTSSANAAN
jgi:DNA gyrase/topoisomerase IV subunit A